MRSIEIFKELFFGIVWYNGSRISSCVFPSHVSSAQPEFHRKKVHQPPNLEYEATLVEKQRQPSSLPDKFFIYLHEPHLNGRNPSGCVFLVCRRHSRSELYLPLRGFYVLTILHRHFHRSVTSSLK